MTHRCYYSPASHSIIDLIDGEGLTTVCRETAEQVRARYPDAIEMDYDEAAALFEAASITPPERIASERFYDMLNVLPPVRWHASPSFEHFELFERINGRIAAYFIRAGADFWQFQDKLGMSTEQVAERIRKAEAGKEGGAA